MKEDLQQALNASVKALGVIKDRRKRNFWKSIWNRRAFLDELAKKLNIQSTSDWNNVSSDIFFRNGARSLLQYYNDSPYQMLSSLYPEIDWKSTEKRSRQRKFWKTDFNQRSFMDSVASKLNIQQMSDWYKWTRPLQAWRKQLAQDLPKLPFKSRYCHISRVPV
eukprot:TRINITY_DN9888_c0_g1_i1.p1 TRINITY_DN9888_c0_g1~~TRINITY_DN9888_c0_g1_i1.p1  ORF type:complete len:164 (+),score=14.30 TRINITY_DN9888_c0_g1_i1:508-999(+)